MNYNDTVLRLWLEILDILDIFANKILIINFSNYCKQFQRLKRFPKFCLHKGNDLENLI